MEQIFPARLRTAMKAKNITQVILAKGVEVGQSTVSNWLNGAVPRSDKLTKIAEMLGTTVAYLLGDDDMPPPEPVDDAPLNVEEEQFFYGAGRQKLKAARESKGISQATLAKQTGYSLGVYQNIEEGRSAMSRKQAAKVAEVLGISIHDLIDGADEPPSRSVPFGTFGETPDIVLPKGMKAKFVPLLSMAQCGKMMAYDDTAYTHDGFLALNNKDPKAFAVTLSGYSMLPDFSPGDVAIVNPSREPKQGGLVIAKLKGKGGDADGGDVMLKRYHRHGDKVTLSSVNDTLFPPMTYSQDDFVWLYHVPVVMKNYD